MTENKKQIYETNVLVIGAGLAGLRAALSAREKGVKVAIVAKGKGSSPEVMGFNAVLGPEDSVETYYQDILRSGLGIADQKLAHILADGSRKVVKELEDLGMVFDQNQNGYDLMHPLGCSYPRLVHFQALTGRNIIDLLQEKAHAAGVEIIRGVTVTDLVQSEGRLIGACGLSNAGELIGFKARAVVLATGGCGRLYDFTTYPADITSDGYAMAYDAGAELVDMEFMQYEPCGFVYPDSIRGHIISTTTLTAGAEMKNRHNEQFLGERGKKLQKDELSRAMYREIAEGRGTEHGGVYYDVTMLPRDFIVKDHCIFYDPALKAGIDLMEQSAEVAPAAHTSLGGVRIDEFNQTSVKGLFAAGEVVGGLHGANRLGGNSGAETLVFGARAGRYAAESVLAENDQETCNHFEALLNSKQEEIGSSRIHENPASNPKEILKRISVVMQEAGGIIRSAEGMQRGLEALEEIEKLYPEISVDNPLLLREKYKIRNMLITGKAILKAALTREESRGAHYRQDYSKHNDSVWLKKIIINKKGGQMQLVTRKINEA